MRRRQGRLRSQEIRSQKSQPLIINIAIVYTSSMSDHREGKMPFLYGIFVWLCTASGIVLQVLERHKTFANIRM
jgi:hypothetical protein